MNRSVADAGSARGRALVRMFETVTASHWTSGTLAHGEVDDLRPLLLLMDIGSCASAEKHTRVQCVTASMGDVAIEHFPRVGELLELRASPVSVGRTSLDVAVLVVAHGGDGTTAGAPARRVCEAFFTYVTTRGPDGEKRFAPPLEVEAEADDCAGCGTDHRQWERTLAQFRKELIRSEQAMVRRRKEQQQKTQSQRRLQHVAESVFESTEVVLPSHQNHMGHLFGGQVMGWMSKSVVAGCVVATGLPLAKFRVRSIQRVDFPTGADVSDHVHCRPRITAIFEGGRSAEVEMRVSKRKVMPGDEGDAAAARGGHDEINVGYFYVSGTHSADGGAPLSDEVAPFAGLLRARPETYATDSSYNAVERGEAYERRNAMIARCHLLAGVGAPIAWDASLASQAPLLTIMSVLRFCDEYKKSCAASSAAKKEGDEAHALVTTVEVVERGGGGGGPLWQSIDFKRTVPSDEGNVQVQPADKCIVRGKTVLRRKKKASATGAGRDDAGNDFLEDVLVTIRDKRPQWDPSCKAVDILETADEQNKVDWAIVEHRTGDMGGTMAGTAFCLLRAAAYIGEDGSVSPAAGAAGAGAARGGAVLASRSISHPRSAAADNWIAPSGWLLTRLDGTAAGAGAAAGDEVLEVTYVAEFDFGDFRRARAPTRTGRREAVQEMTGKWREGLVANLRDGAPDGLPVPRSKEDAAEGALLNAPGMLLGQCFRNLAAFDHAPGA